MRKGGRLAAKANYLWVVLSTWFELADEAKTAEAPKCAEIVFVPDGVERCVDFQLKSSPVLGTTVELEYLEMALEWFALHVKQQYVIDSKKFAGLKAEFVVRDGAIFDVDQLDTGRFVASTQILKTVNVIAHYAGCRISHFDKVPKPMSGYNMVFNVFAPYLRKVKATTGGLQDTGCIRLGMTISLDGARVVQERIAVLAAEHLMAGAAKHRIEGAVVAVRWFADEAAAAASRGFECSNDRKRGSGGGGVDSAA